jgi:hypothetical protein
MTTPAKIDVRALREQMHRYRSPVLWPNSVMDALLAVLDAAKLNDKTFYMGDGPEAQAMRDALAPFDFGDEKPAC